MGNSVNLTRDQYAAMRPWSFVEGTTIGKDETPLPHFVVRLGNLSTFIILIRNKFNFNFADKYGNTPLHYAAAKNDSRFLDTLLREGLDPCQQNDKGETPLMIAVKEKQYTHVHPLKDAIFIPDNKMRGPIHVAIEAKDYSMIGFLIKNTPDIPMKWVLTYALMTPIQYHLNSFPNEEGFTALGLAVILMDENMVRTLISYKADANALYKGKSAKNILADIGMKNMYGGLNPTKHCTKKEVLRMWSVLNGDNNVYRNIYDRNTRHTGLLTGEYKNY